ncbi:unnamed protein product [Prunus brigantina]
MSLLFSSTVSLCFVCSTFSDFLFLCSRLGSSLPISMSFLGLLVSDCFFLVSVSILFFWSLFLLFANFLFCHLFCRVLYFFLMTVGPRFLTYRRLLSLRTIINLAWDNIVFCHRKCAVIIWKKTCN